MSFEGIFIDCLRLFQCIVKAILIPFVGIFKPFLKPSWGIFYGLFKFCCQAFLMHVDGDFNLFVRPF